MMRFLSKTRGWMSATKGLLSAGIVAAVVAVPSGSVLAATYAPQPAPGATAGANGGGSGNGSTDSSDADAGRGASQPETSAGSGGLAFTGTDIALLTGVGTAAVVGGGIVILTTRRRRTGVAP